MKARLRHSRRLPAGIQIHTDDWTPAGNMRGWRSERILGPPPGGSPEVRASRWRPAGVTPEHQYGAGM